MNKVERQKLVESFFDEEILISLGREELENLYKGFPEIPRKAVIRESIDREKGVYFTPYEKEAKRHSMSDLPLNGYDYQRLHSSKIDNPSIYMDETMYDLFLALLTNKKLPNIGEKTRDNLIIGLRIFRDFVRDFKKAYPNSSNYGLLSKDYKLKSRIVDYKWPSIVEYVTEELKTGDKKLICACREPRVLANGTFHLTENDYRTKHAIAQYSLVDELIDGNFDKSVGRLVISK